MKNEGKTRKKRYFFKICIAIIFTITCCGCFRQHVNDFGIVTSVEKKDPEFPFARDKKYRITVGQEFNTRFKTKCYIYTNKLYQVGDTIIIR